MPTSLSYDFSGGENREGNHSGIEENWEDRCSNGVNKGADDFFLLESPELSYDLQTMAYKILFDILTRLTIEWSQRPIKIACQ